MQMIRWVLFSIVFLLVLSCASETQLQDSAQSEWSDTEEDELNFRGLSSQESGYQWNLFLTRRLTEEKLLNFKKECNRKRRVSGYCELWRNSSRFEDTRVPPSAKQLVVKEKSNIQEIKFQYGKILQLGKWNRLKPKESVGSLDLLSIEERLVISRSILSSKKCPSNLSLALGASLESYLMEQNKMELISQLYVHGARCFQPGHSERELFFTRAGLIQVALGNFSSALQMFKKAYSSDAFNSRSLYWKMTMEERLGRVVEAQKTKRRILKSYAPSFHAKLIQEVQVDEEERSPGSKGGHLQKRQKELYQVVKELSGLGYRRSATVVADYLCKKYFVPFHVKRELAHFSESWFAIKHLSAALTWTARRDFIRELYPLSPNVSFSELRDAKTLLPLLSIARRESSFDPWIVSPAGAIGLMQINPETAKKFGVLDKNKLFDSKINLKVSEQYLMQLQEEFKEWPMVFAAYNAGEEKVREWKERYRFVNRLWWMDMIPYRETREYASQVMANLVSYESIYRKEVTSVSGGLLVSF